MSCVRRPGCGSGRRRWRQCVCRRRGRRQPCDLAREGLWPARLSRPRGDRLLRRRSHDPRFRHPGGAVQWAASASQALVNAPTGSGTYSKQLDLAPYSAQDFEDICAGELGGEWADGTPHPDVEEEEKYLLLGFVRVWGRCTGDAADTVADATTKVQVTCTDTDHPGS